MVVKAQISIWCEISLRGALFCSLLNSLILSVIFCEASDKPLAFQFANKTQHSQGRKGIMNWELEFMSEINFREIWNDIFWNKISVLFLDEKNQKLSLWDGC